MKFFAKHMKSVLLIVVILTLVLGLWYQNGHDGEYSRTEFLMDTECTVTVYGKEAKAAVSAAFEEIKKINFLTDFYNDESDISRINKADANAQVMVDERIIDILETALEISEKSGGAFDVTIASLSQLWNFGGADKRVPAAVDIEKAKENAGFEKILIDRERLAVTKTESGTQMDLGGAAKGYAADRAVSIIEKYDITGAIIDLGGNVSCMGKNPANRSGEWRIGVQVPFSVTGEYGEVISLETGSVVTSGTYQRNFEVDGKLYHHILDPFTGYPAEQEYSSVTITADNSLLADCLSTACFVLGKDAGTALAKEYGAGILYQ